MIVPLNRKVIRYRQNLVPGYVNEYMLREKIDAKGNSTLFDYSIDQGNFSLLDKTYRVTPNYYANLRRITYPTEAMSSYSYEMATGNMGNLGSMEYYKVKTREDNVQGYICNEETYNYIGDYTGYMYCDDPEFLPDNFTFKTNVVDNSGLTIEHTFNNKHLLFKKVLMDNYQNSIKEMNYQYNLDKLPVSETILSYGLNGSFSQKQTHSEYNEYGDVTRHINELGGETYYNYDPVYHLPRLVYNLEDGVISNKVEYGIDPGNGNIDWMKKHHYENGVDKSITTLYYYDSYGNISKESMVQKDGRLIEKYYNYDYEYRNAYLTGIKTRATDYMGNVSLITETFEYDFFTGNKTAYVNGNGNRFTYRYDDIGRLIEEGNPDNTYKTINYDDIRNTTIVTNENSYSIRQQYDGLGRSTIKEELTESGWVTIEEKHYNTLGELDYTRDASGNLTRYQYDLLGRLIRTIYPDESITRTQYEDERNLKIVNDEENHKHYYVYDNAGNLKEEWEDRIDENNYTRQHKVIYSYTKFGKLRYTTDLSTNATTEYIYDDLDRLIAVKNPLNERASYEYDNLNNVIKQITSGGSATEKYYDELGRLYQEKDPLQKSEYTSYDGANNVIEKKDRNGTVLRYTFDSLNRLKVVNNATTNTVIAEYQYDVAGNVISAKNAEGTTRFEYYLNGKLKKEISSDGKYIYYEYRNDGSTSRMIDQFGKATTYGYDLRGRLDTVTIDGKTTTYQYFRDGSREYVRYPDGIKEEYFYDECNNLTKLINRKANGTIINQFVYTYDDVRNQKTKIDEDGRTEYSYDVLNRVTSVLNPDGTKISYVYDRNGNVDLEILRIISTGETYTTDYIYDSALCRLERVIKESPIKLKSLSITPTERHALADEQLTFTISGTKDDGSVLTDEVLNNATWTVNSSIIKLNTSQGKTITAVIPRAGWDTMPQTAVITVTASLQGKIVEAKVYKGTVKTPILQNLSITPTETHALADQQLTFTISGTMDDGSAATDEILNKATWTVSLPTLKLNGAQGKTIIGAIPRTEWEAMLSTDVITITVVLQGKTAEAKVQKGTPILQSLSITPSSANINPGDRKIFTLSGLMNDGTIASDSLLNTAIWTPPINFYIANRIGKTVTVECGIGFDSTDNSKSSEESNGIIINPSNSIHVKLQASIGSIIAEADITTTTPPSGPPDPPTEPYGNPNEKLNIPEENVLTSSSELELQNQISSIIVDRTTTYYTYDNNGNMISQRIAKAIGEEVTNYEFNELNQLVQISNPSGTTSYTYNPSGLRETKTSEGEQIKYYYDGQNVIIETINNNFCARNIFGINPIARETNGSKLYYLYNGHADVVAMVDSSGNIINSYDYDIYGNIKEVNEQGIENPIRYAGQYYDSESNLYYLRARYYDPELMRFISEDTNKGDVKDPLSLNLYTYCQGNPIMYFDHSGNNPLIVAAYFLAMWATAIMSSPDFYTDSMFLSDDIARNDWGSALLDGGAMALPVVPGGVGRFKDTIKFSDKISDGSKIIAQNMDEFFELGFGRSIKKGIQKTSIMFKGANIYKVIDKIDNKYLKKGFGFYLDTLHYNHIEVIDKKGLVVYVLNLDGTLNIEKTKKAVGRLVKEWNQ